MQDPRSRSDRYAAHTGSEVELIRVQLTESLSQGGHAAAKILYPTGPAGAVALSDAIVTVYDTINRFSGSSGDNFLVAFFLDSQKLEIVSPAPAPSVLRRIELTSSLTLGGSANAKFVEYNGVAWVLTADTLTAYDSLNRFTGTNGDRFWVTQPTDSNFWEIVSPSTGSDVTEPVRFELTATLSLGGSAAAKIVTWDGAAYVAGDVITVRDFTASPGTWRGKSGYRGWAQLKNDRGDYEIIWMERLARYIEFALTENMGATTAHAANASITGSDGDYWDGKNPDAGTPDVVVYDDRHLFDRALNGAKGLAVWDEIEDHYQIVECETKAGLIRATVGSDTLSSGEALGNASGFSLTASSGTQQDIQAPTADATLKLRDDDSLFKRALSGAKTISIFDVVNNRYVVVESQSQAGWIKFTTTGTFSGSPSSASASFNNVGGTQQDTQSPGSSGTVVDLMGIYSRAPSGSIGLAVYDNVNDRYVVIVIQNMAGFVYATLNEDMGATVFGRASATVRDFGGTQPDIISPGSTVTVRTSTASVLGYLELLTDHLLEDDEVLAVYDALDNDYKIVFASHVNAATHVTRITGTVPDGDLLPLDTNAVTWLHLDADTANDKIVIRRRGTYKLQLDVYCQDTAAGSAGTFVRGSEFRFLFQVNGIDPYSIVGYVTGARAQTWSFDEENIPISSSGHCIVKCDPGDEITVKVISSDATDCDVVDGQFSVVRIGERTAS